MHFRRVIFEQFGQALAIGTSVLDRLVLTAFLVRYWTEDQFEAWATCLAVAGLVSLFEFGFSLYFNNRLMEEMEQRRIDEAARTFFLANTLFSLVGLLGFLSVAAAVFFPSVSGLHLDGQAAASVLALTAAQSVRIAASGFLYLYRANQQYARYVFTFAAGDLVRIGASIIACVSGGGLLSVAVIGSISSAILQVFLPATDARRRFPPNRVGFAMPRREEVGPILRTSSAFFAQTIPIVLLTSMPVLYLRDQSLAAGTLAAFVLMRTLSGVPRALLQQFGTVLGQECGRRIALADRTGANRIVAEGARLYSVMSGLATGLLLGAGLDISLVWTGNVDYFRLDYLIAASLPMVFGAFAVLAHNILTNTNAPLFATVARWLQLALTGACVVLLPIEDPALAMLVALTIGEVVGYIPLAYRGVSRLVPGTDGWFHVTELVASLGAAAVSTVLTLGVLAVVPSSTVTARAAAIALAGVGNACLIPWLGLRSETRKAFVGFLQPRLLHLASCMRNSASR